MNGDREHALTDDRDPDVNSLLNLALQDNRGGRYGGGIPCSQSIDPRRKDDRVGIPLQQGVSQWLSHRRGAGEKGFQRDRVVGDKRLGNVEPKGTS